MKGNENVMRKSCAVALLSALALSLCTPQMLVAQVSTQGNQTHGMFGNRTLGQSLVPRPSTFGGGVQTSSYGSFLYLGRSDGVAAFATPWRQADVSPPQQIVGANPAAQPALNAPVSTQTPAAENNNIPVAATPLSTDMNGLEGTSLADQTIGMSSGIGAPVASRSIMPRFGSSTASATPRGTQSPVRSPELSERLTRIARSKGMLAGQGIDVYLGNDVAVVRGAVRAPGNGVLLANLLALEPEVRQIDNQLVVAGAGTLSPNQP